MTVNVSKGAGEGDFIEVVGPLQPGDKIIKRANELREGTTLQNPKKCTSVLMVMPQKAPPPFMMHWPLQKHPQPRLQQIPMENPA